MQYTVKENAGQSKMRRNVGLKFAALKSTVGKCRIGKCGKSYHI